MQSICVSVCVYLCVCVSVWVAQIITAAHLETCNLACTCLLMNSGCIPKSRSVWPNWRVKIVNSYFAVSRASHSMYWLLYYFVRNYFFNFSCWFSFPLLQFLFSFRRLVDVCIELNYIKRINICASDFFVFFCGFCFHSIFSSVCLFNYRSVFVDRHNCRFYLPKTQISKLSCRLVMYLCPVLSLYLFQ